jgi:hypothetical protein
MDRASLRARSLITTAEYAPVHDHARLPWRFFARLTADGRLIG